MFRQASGTQVGQIGSAEHRARRQPGLIGDRAGRDRPIPGDHHHAHAGRAGRGDGGGRIGAQGIGLGDQAEGFKEEVMDVAGRLATGRQGLATMETGTAKPLGHGHHLGPAPATGHQRSRQDRAAGA